LLGALPWAAHGVSVFLSVIDGCPAKRAGAPDEEMV